MRKTPQSYWARFFAKAPVLNRTAFTLTELIAVIGLTVLVAALLIPGVGLMRERSDAAVCV